MTPKEVRRKILETLYEHRADDFGIPIDKLQQALPELDEKTLHQEISYLKQKYWLHISAEFGGKEYLNYHFVGITANGIDLVEDPDKFGKIFSIHIDAHQNHFSNISDSNITIDSQYVSQIIDKQDGETQASINQLLEATDKRDKDAMLQALTLISDKSLDLLIAIITGGMKL